MNFTKKGVTILCLIIAISIGVAYAATEPKPVLYGQAFDGLNPADGATVTVYPQAVPLDTLTDTVGATGNTGISSWWKINLANLQTNVQNGNIVVVGLTNGVKETSRTYTVDESDGAVLINLNLDPDFQDNDNDGFNGDVDCNDNDPSVNPNANEVCDSVDNDCNDGVDEGLQFTFYQDSDLDEFGNANAPQNACVQPEGYAGNDDDCDDTDNGINPNAEEICGDGIDQDCDGSDDECPFSAQFQIYDGWTSFALPYKPAGIDNSQEIGQAIMDYTGLVCTVVMRFDGPTQLMQDDILLIEDDPSFSLIGTEGYFINCDGPGLFIYQGTLWE
ncbi:putative metal-binding motif-containing protein [Candidatus Woesearchaeota archaeon]|nr:putative metal-binding motif-containing protein [Candidatus Woesearchaeota archaeon]